MESITGWQKAKVARWAMISRMPPEISLSSCMTLVLISLSDVPTNTSAADPEDRGLLMFILSHHHKQLPRLSGWWGNDPKTRFQMQLQPDFIPYGGAYSWQVSTPSILAMIPLAASLEIFEEAGIENLRKKSELQTAFLMELLDLAPFFSF